MRYTTVIMCLIAVSCGRKKEVSNTVKTDFEGPVSASIVHDNKIQEASGLVASVVNPGMLWTHNDSGNASDLFLIDTKGEIKCIVHLGDTENRDWEDITIGPGPEKGKNYVYIGEIGDNAAVYNSKFLYRLEEPYIPAAVSDTTIRGTAKIEFTLSDGTRDTEALAFDPLSGNYYIFSKRESQVNLYKLTAPLASGESVVAERVVEKLPFTQIVALDISKDGTEILAKNYDHVLYWRRTPGETIEATIVRAPADLPYKKEPQGESIAFARDGSGYYTISEWKKETPQHLYFYKRSK
jgi:hypothetical protein